MNQNKIFNMSSFYIYTRVKIFVFLKIMLFVGCSAEMPSGLTWQSWLNLVAWKMHFKGWSQETSFLACQVNLSGNRTLTFWFSISLDLFCLFHVYRFYIFVLVSGLLFLLVFTRIGNLVLLSLVNEWWRSIYSLPGDIHSGLRCFYVCLLVSTIN